MKLSPATKVLIAICIFLFIVVGLIIYKFWPSSNPQTDSAHWMSSESTTDLKSDRIITDKPDLTAPDYIVQEVHLDNADGPSLGYVEIHKDGTVISKGYDLSVMTTTNVKYNKKTKKFEAASTSGLKIKEKSRVGNDKWLNRDYPIQTKTTIKVDDWAQPDRSFANFAVEPIAMIGMGYPFKQALMAEGALGLSFVNIGRSCYAKNLDSNRACNSDFKALGVMVDLDFDQSKKFINRTGFSIVPIMINTRVLHAPLLNNVYLTPYLGMQNTAFKTGIGLSLSM